MCVARLEDTPFVNKLDLELYWSHYAKFTPQFNSHLREICVAKWSASQYAKSVCFSRVLTYWMNLRLNFLQMSDDDNILINFPPGMEFTTLMFAIRTFSPNRYYTFPYRYSKYEHFSYDFTFDQQVRLAMEGFAGKQPYMLNLCLKSTATTISDRELNLFDNLECMEIVVTAR